jgi:uncharacterized membrane protein
MEGGISHQRQRDIKCLVIPPSLRLPMVTTMIFSAFMAAVAGFNVWVNSPGMAVFAGLISILNLLYEIKEAIDKKGGQ